MHVTININTTPNVGGPSARIVDQTQERKKTKPGCSALIAIIMFGQNRTQFLVRDYLSPPGDQSGGPLKGPVKRAEHLPA
ncbi:ankyrin-3-like isoform 1 [Anopheles sinensis]|uniref:Ankyrin-3-like isoform 1 n=1 Tax=Anopheles sinensis TaxID=74873 RepID=A0A084VYD2_ANOSI|nr:ankyrin-3-like isoform 1 [Anopheles sinensis]